MSKLDYLRKQVGELPVNEKAELFIDLSTELQDSEELIGEDESPRVVKFSEYRKGAIERLYNPNKIYGVATGYSNLDAIMHGMDGGDLIVVGADSAIGKSSFGQNIIHKVADRNIPVFYISLEMTNDESEKRFIEMDMDYHPCADRNENIERIMNMPLYAFPHEQKITIKTIDEAIKLAVEELGVKVVMIDHLHYFNRGGTGNDSSEIGSIIRAIKLMARKYNVPIITVSHVTKPKGKSRPTMHDLRDSSFIYQDADIVIMLDRDKFSEDPAERQLLKFWVEKNRPRNDIGEGELRITKGFNMTEQV